MDDPRADRRIREVLKLTSKPDGPGDMLGLVRFGSHALGGYFKPMRRKIGIATLAMACVITAMWITCLYDYTTPLIESITVKYTSIITAPFWLMAIPLSLLSAWLLLSKVREKPTDSPPTTENRVVVL